MAVIAAELVRLREDVGVAVADRVLVSVLAAVPEADGEAVLELDADVDEDDEGELVDDGEAVRVEVRVLVVVTEGTAECDGVGVPVGLMGARATPRKAVLGAAVASGEPPFTHVRLDGENAYSAAAVTA